VAKFRVLFSGSLHAVNQLRVLPTETGEQTLRSQARRGETENRSAA
jgi:hypothetical protein